MSTFTLLFLKSMGINYFIVCPRDYTGSILTASLEGENLKPGGQVQRMFVEKWQVVRMRVLRDVGVWYSDRQVAEKLRSFPVVGPARKPV